MPSAPAPWFAETVSACADNETSVAWPVADVTFSVPVIAPPEPGANTTVTVQDEPAASVQGTPGQASEAVPDSTMKRDVVVTDEIVAAVAELLEMRTVSGWLRSPVRTVVER